MKLMPSRTQIVALTVLAVVALGFAFVPHWGPPQFRYTGSNPDFWHGSPRPQYARALFEIVCWDSSATLLIGADDTTILDAFRTAYPGALDLDVENRSRY